MGRPILKPVRLKAKPESLSKVLKILSATDLLAPEEHFSVGSKIELACKSVNHVSFHSVHRGFLY